MEARGYWAPWANLIDNGKKTNLTPYPGKLLNINLLSQSARNPTHLTAFSFSLERFITHLPILASFPIGEIVRQPKWPNNLSSTSRSSSVILMSKGFSSLNNGRRKLLTTSSKLIVISPTEKKKVWRKGQQRRTKCLRPLASLKLLKFLEIAIAFREPTNSPSESSLSTQMGQPMIFLGTKSKKIGTAPRDSHLIWSSKIFLRSGTWAELVKPAWLENT